MTTLLRDFARDFRAAARLSRFFDLLVVAALATATARCAPVDDAVTGSQATVNPPAATALDPATQIAPGVVPMPVNLSDPHGQVVGQTYAPRVDLGDPSARFADPTAAALLPAGVMAPRLSALTHVVGELRFDDGSFNATVNRIATRMNVKGGALPQVAVENAAAARDWMRGLVAESAGVTAENVHFEKYACPTALGCATSFIYTVMSANPEYGAAVANAAYRVSTTAEDVGATIWSPVREGAPMLDVVTLHGMLNGRLVGLVYYR